MPSCRTPLVTLNTFEIEHPHLTDINNTGQQISTFFSCKDFDT